MKKLLSVSVLFLCSIVAWAFTVDGINYNITSTSELTVEVSSGSYSGDIVIPEKVEYNENEYSVTSIGLRAFYDCSGLTSVTIPNSVTSIMDGAFDSCSGLTSVTIPNSVTSIGDWAFMDCSSLTSVTIPNSITSIGGYAFYGTGWYNSQSNGFLYLDQILLGFKGSEPIGDLTINLGTRIIANKAFEGCSGLTSVIIPNSVTSIGEYAFYLCSGLTSLTIGNSVTSIGRDAFSCCSGLTSIEVESGNHIYDSRDKCNAIIETNSNTLIVGCQKTTIPNSVTSIGNPAFFVCSGLTSVTIPNSVTSIMDGAFSGCSSLTSINVESGNTTYDSRDDCNAIIETNTNTLISGCKNTIIPNSVTSIGDWAFYMCSGLTSVTIPNSVTSIGNGAFAGCSGLNSVTIPNSVTSIGNSAFNNCSGLTSVTIPNSVTSIGGNAFAGCSSLTSVTIPNSVTNIGGAAFYDCSGLTSVTIPNSVTSIGNGAFRGCSGLTEIYSMITEPFEINTNCWRFVNKDIPLYVPAGTKAKYEATSGWNEFTNIVEMNIAPVDDGQNVDFNTEIDENTNLDGNIVGDIFYSISSGDGSYNAAEGCLIVTKPTNDSDIDGKDIFGEDFKDNYTGIVFKVKPGKGTVNVVAETQGNMVMKVKIGDSEPLVLDFEGKMKVSFPYNVSEASLVYIYGGMSSAGGKTTGATRASADEDLLKIYGFEVVSDQTGIETIDVGESSTPDAIVYNLNGQRVNKAGKGVFIKNGRKILVK